MESHIFFLSSILTISFFLTTLPKSLCQPDEHWDCHASFRCGKVENISYPFWSGNLQPPYCRSDGFELNCQEDQFPSIQVGSQYFSVLKIDSFNYTMTIRRKGLVYDDCSSDFTSTSLNTPHNLFRYRFNVKNVTLLYDCSSELSISLNYFKCQNQTNKFVYYVEDDDTSLQSPEFDKCGRPINVTISQTSTLGPERGLEDLKSALDHGFDVIYAVDGGASCFECEKSGGRCGSNGTDDNSHFICHCRDGTYLIDCPDDHPVRNKKWRWKVIVGVAAGLITVILMSIAFFFYRRRQKNSYAKSYIQSQATSSDSSLMDPEKGSKYFGVHLFTYTELEEATNYFDSAKELGDGGFGTVYFGKLRDGRCVAVKRLYENNYKRVEQFMNEVEILTRLRHQNLVSLYGCTSRHSRELLLVYEYIPNGTVADHLHGERAEPGSLPWHIRIKIAIETASALAYLHASDIIHRDVKTNNILLDDHFCVKVADFGLSRLFPNDVTHISTAPQGTPGYVDPEYHECYQLTDKSDVYSFGVVLIELISSMPAVDITRHRHEINLSTMAINKIQNRALHELVEPTLGFESDYKVRKMINAVAELAFQCLQSLKDMRPSMEEVLDTLRDIESDGKHKSKPEVMDISADDVVLLKNDLPPSPDSNLVSKSTTLNDSK